MEKIYNILTEFEKYSAIDYKWNLKRINNFNNTLTKINTNIGILEDKELKIILRQLHFILNDLKNKTNKFNPEDIKVNTIKLSSFLFDALIGNTTIRPENISLILNAFDNFGYDKNDLYNNALSIDILINIISTIVLTRGNSQNISNTLKALYHFGFTIDELIENGFDLKLLFKAINNNVLTDTNSLDIINILNNLYNFGFNINDMVQNGLNIKFLFQNINHYILSTKNIDEIINTTYILAKFKYNRESLIEDGFDINLLSNIINTNILKSDNTRHISELFYNLSKFGYDIKTLKKDKINTGILFNTINYKILKYGNLKDIKFILKALSNMNYTLDTIIKNRLNTILLFCTTNNIVLTQKIPEEINEIINVLFDFGYQETPIINNFNAIKPDLFEIIIKDASFYANAKLIITSNINYLTDYKHIINEQLKIQDLNIELLINRIIENITLCNDITNILSTLESLYLIIDTNNINVIKNIEYIIDISDMIYTQSGLEEAKTFICTNMEYLKYNLKLNMTNQLEIMLKDYKINDINISSIFEQYFKRFIYNNIQDNENIKIVQDKTIKQEIDGTIYTHRPNFIITDNDKKYIIELDEIAHLPENYKNIKHSIINNRNNLLKKYCEKKDIIYVNISDDKFDLFRYRKFKNFKQFLEEENIIKKQNTTQIDVKKFNFNAGSFVKRKQTYQTQTNMNLTNISKQLENSLNDITEQCIEEKKFKEKK